MKMKILKSKVEVDFSEFGIESVIAKVDPGAYSGCFHATNIKVIKSKGADLLEFSPFDHPEKKYTTIHFIKKRVKSSNGQIEERYFIDTDIVIDKEDYPVRLSLSDRRNMRWPVLLGRKFLRQHGFLVDVR